MSDSAKHVWFKALQANPRSATTDQYHYARLALEELDEFEQRDLNEFFGAVMVELESLDEDTESQLEKQHLEKDLEMASEVMARLIERYRGIFARQARDSSEL